MRPRLQPLLAVFVTLSLWLWRGGYLAAILATCAAGLALLAWRAPRAYAPIARAFDRFGHFISIGFTWLALGLVYFGLLTPLRIWRACRGHDPLARRPDPARTSYLTAFSKTPPRFDRPF